MIHCWKCKTEKPDEDFNWENKKLDKRKRICRSCMKVYHRKWYRESYKFNKKRKTSTEHQHEKMKRSRLYSLNYLKTHPCVDCGETDPVVLEYDHVDKSVKYKRRTRVFYLVQHGYSQQRIDEEISRCEVRCANCHRRKTAKQQGWYQSL
jgi:hypothetical protein